MFNYSPAVEYYEFDWYKHCLFNLQLQLTITKQTLKLKSLGERHRLFWELLKNSHKNLNKKMTHVQLS